MDPALKNAEIVGMPVATMTESSVETTMQSARPRKQAITLRNGRRFVWSVRYKALSDTRGLSLESEFCDGCGRGRTPVISPGMWQVLVGEGGWNGDMFVDGEELKEPIGHYL